MIYLLDTVCDKFYFFTGDNAQNISKGIAYKFTDLKQMIVDLNLSKKDWAYNHKEDLNLHHLTYNWRSHSQILDAANNTIGMLEIFFPKSIDILSKESSPIQGPKPIVFEIGSNSELIKTLLFEILQHGMLEGQGEVKQNYEFGCNQVILVKSEEAKEYVAEIFKHALCLTIVEAKGMEFDDVILFDFFTYSIRSVEWMNLVDMIKLETKILTQWEVDQTDLLDQNCVMSEKTEINGETKWILTIMSLDVEKKAHWATDSRTQKYPNVRELQRLENEAIIAGRPVEKKLLSGILASTFDDLCDELKLFYVASTRAKKRLFIFDQNIELGAGIFHEGQHQRSWLDAFWKKLGIMTFIDDRTLQYISDYSKSITSGKPFNRDEYSITDNQTLLQIDILKKYVGKFDTAEWRRLGLKFYKRNQFELALRCFVTAGDNTLKDRAEGAQLAMKAGEKLKFLNDPKKNKNCLQSVLLELEVEMKRDFQTAAKIFLRLDKKKDAARCYFSAKAYDDAIPLFLECEEWSSAAQCFFLQEKYWDARNLFQKANDPWREVDCLSKLGEFEKIVEIMSVDNKFLTPLEREMFLKKYIRLMLEQMSRKVAEAAGGELESESDDTDPTEHAEGGIDVEMSGDDESSGDGEPQDGDLPSEHKTDIPIVETKEAQPTEDPKDSWGDDFMEIDEFNESFVEISIIDPSDSFVN
jgi:hypothetical protein